MAKDNLLEIVTLLHKFDLMGQIYKGSQIFILNLERWL